MADRNKRIVDVLKSMNADEIVGASGEERFNKVKKFFPNIDRS